MTGGVVGRSTKAHVPFSPEHSIIFAVSVPILAF